MRIVDDPSIEFLLIHVEKLRRNRARPVFVNGIRYTGEVFTWSKNVATAPCRASVTSIIPAPRRSTRQLSFP